MALIALKKDKDFLRVAVATGKRGMGRIQLDQALSVELAGEIEELSPARLGDKLRAILSSVGVQKGDAIVVVPRGDVEMRQFQLPPVPDEELPEMVRFQSRNHFSSFSDDSLLDFVPLSRNDDHSTVLAATISANAVQRLRDIIEPAGLRLRNIVVRPFAAAELVRSSHPSPDCRVVMEIIGREADISVVDDDAILMTRTVRVPDSYTDEQFDAWLPGEVRRTIAAAQGQSGARDVSEVIVFGDPSDHQRLAKDLQESFQLKVRFLAPFESIATGGRFEKPAQNQGFASLLGSLVQSASPAGIGLDFLNPRKKPEKRMDRKKVFTGVGIAASLLLLGLLTVWWVLGSRDARIAELQEDINEIRQFTNITDDTLKNTEPLDVWKSRQTNWLDELYQLSQILPDPDQTRLGRFNGTSSRPTAAIDIRGLLKETTMRDLMDRLENRYSAKPNDDPTREGGFEREYRIGLEFPFATVTPHGQVIPFEHEPETAPDTAESNGEAQ